MLSWSSTEKVLIPSVTDEVGQSGFNLDNGESPDAVPATGKADNDGDTDDVTNNNDDQKIDDQKTDDQNGKSICEFL